MSRLVLPVALLLSMSACATAPPPPGAAVPPSGQCNAEGARWAIGRGIDDDTTNRILRDTGSRDARVLKPGMGATMDYRPDRINIDLNDRGAITGLRCG